MRYQAIWRHFVATTVIGSVALVAALGCASVDVSQTDRYRGPKLSRPERIIVHDFAAIPGDLPSWSEARSQFSGTAVQQTTDELETGRKLGALVAAELVAKIKAMGLNAVRAAGQGEPREGEIVLVGYFTSLDEGSAAKRVMLGFGSGASELTTHVEGYRMTDRGLEKLGSGETSSSAGKTPGMFVPLLVTIATANPIGLLVGGAVKVVGERSGKSGIEGTAKRTAGEIAEVLEQRFQEQGWI